MPLPHPRSRTTCEILPNHDLGRPAPSSVALRIFLYLATGSEHALHGASSVTATAVLTQWRKTEGGCFCKWPVTFHNNESAPVCVPDPSLPGRVFSVDHKRVSGEYMAVLALLSTSLPASYPSLMARIGSYRWYSAHSSVSTRVDTILDHFSNNNILDVTLSSGTSAVVHAASDESLLCKPYKPPARAKIDADADAKRSVHQ